MTHEVSWTCGLCHFFLAQKPCFHRKILLHITPKWPWILSRFGSEQNRIERVISTVNLRAPSRRSSHAEVPFHLHRVDVGHCFRASSDCRRDSGKGQFGLCGLPHVLG